MSFVFYLIMMLFAVFNPSRSATNPNSETKKNNIETSAQQSTEERMKARLAELGIPEGVLFSCSANPKAISHRFKGDLSSLPIHSKETRKSECPDVTSDVIAYR